MYYSHSEREDVARKLFETGVCLPSGSGMTEKDQTRVITCIKNILMVSAGM